MGLSRDLTARNLDGRRLRTPEAAEYLGVGESTLEKWRCSGYGPVFERAGTRIVVYRVADLDAFLAARRVNSTSKSREGGLSRCRAAREALPGHGSDRSGLGRHVRPRAQSAIPSRVDRAGEAAAESEAAGSRIRRASRRNRRFPTSRTCTIADRRRGATTRFAHGQ